MLKVTCALIIQNHHILSVQRSEKMNLPLKWEFPGGKLEADENEEECIMREIQEELNIQISILNKLPDAISHTPEFSIELIPFVAIIEKGNLYLREHKKFTWCNSKNILDLDWAQADIPVVNEFLTMNQKEKWIF